ncbi:hypothetical protein TKK_0008435 [Trichogramma kaykai]
MDRRFLSGKKLLKDTFDLHWVIKKSSEFKKTVLMEHGAEKSMCHLESPVHKAKNVSRAEFSLKFLHVGNLNSTIHETNLYLCCKQLRQNELINCNVRIALYKVSKRKTRRYETCSRSFVLTQVPAGTIFHKLITLRNCKIPEFFKNLYVRCEIIITRQEEYYFAYFDGTEGDIEILSACGKSVQAHKSLLSNASPTFSEMFEQEMWKKVNNYLLINDISYDAIVHMVRFLYTGSIETNDPIKIYEVLKAAEKFNMHKLKSTCEEILRRSENGENILQTLHASNAYDAKFLQRRVIRFLGWVLDAPVIKKRDESNKNLSFVAIYQK